MTAPRGMWQVTAPTKGPLSVECPMCGAKPGESCRVWPWKKTKPHAARVRAAQKAREEKP